MVNIYKNKLIDNPEIRDELRDSLTELKVIETGAFKNPVVFIAGLLIKIISILLNLDNIRIIEADPEPIDDDPGSIKRG